MSLKLSMIRTSFGFQAWFILLTILLIPSTGISASGGEDSLTTLKRAQFDNEGNMVLVGETINFDIYIGKVDSEGSLLWSDTFGGSELERVIELIIDRDNNIYILGLTLSSDFEVLNEFQSIYGGNTDYFIRKWNKEGEVLWSTYLGGSGSEEPRRVREMSLFTSNQELIVLGLTSSRDFPTSESAFQSTFGGGDGITSIGNDLVITKLSSTGNLLWSSYIGSSDDDWGTMIFDHEENIIIRGNTAGDKITNSIKTGYEYSGFRDPFLIKINQEGELIFSLYYGGTAEDYNFDFAVDNQNNILMLAPSYSEDFPLAGTPIQSEKGGSNDLTFSKFSPSGDVLWSTYFGGNAQDDYWPGPNLDDTGIQYSPDIFSDSLDNIYFTTSTYSTDLNTKFSQVTGDSSTGQISNFVGKLTAEGSLVYGRYLKGFNMDQELTEDNSLIVAASVSEEGWITDIPLQSEYAGGHDVVYAKLMQNGSLEWSSYLGGSAIDQLVNAMYYEGNLYLLGTTQSNDLPSITNEFQGNTDVFVCQVNSFGSVNWCQYFGTEGIDSTIGGGFLVDPTTGNLFVFGRSIAYDKTGERFEGFLTKTSENGESIWSTQIIPELRIPLDSNNNLPLYLILLVISSFIIGFAQLFRLQRIKSNVRLAEMMMNETISRIISPLFENKPELIYLFGIAKQLKQNLLPEGFVTDIPKEIMDFTYLLHPIRMSIVKLLTDSISLTTIQIKELLDVSWNDINPHLKSMKKKKYITMDKEFSDGQLLTVVRAEPNTITQYQSLKSLLMDFFDATPNIERYIEQVNKWQKLQDEPDLYPRENQ